MRKKSRKNCYRVSNTKTKRVFSKCTSKRKAQRQLRLLRALDSPSMKRQLMMRMRSRGTRRSRRA